MAIDCLTIPGTLGPNSASQTLLVRNSLENSGSTSSMGVLASSGCATMSLSRQARMSCWMLRASLFSAERTIRLGFLLMRNCVSFSRSSIFSCFCSDRKPVCCV